MHYFKLESVTPRLHMLLEVPFAFLLERAARYGREFGFEFGDAFL